jgi:MFS family permease
MRPRGTRLPFFYGWVLVAIGFVTMAVGVNARTAFSLLFPAILDEFQWERGVTAGAFSFGFLVSAVVTPFVGRLMDRRGPRVVIELGVVTMAAGLFLASLSREPWQLYLTLGALAGGGVNCLAYTGQSLYLTNWFVRRRGLALSIAFSGVGIGSITILPWLGWLIASAGWRAACAALGLLVLVLLAPLNLLLKRRPEDLGLLPDGVVSGSAAADRTANVVDHAWAAVDWTLGRALRTTRFWWVALGYFCGLFSWYAVQVHQTTYLIEIGFGPGEAAWALGLVSLVAVPGQIALGHLSDRIGREWVWTIGNAGFVLCCLALIALRGAPSAILLYAMILAQGTLGYSLTSVMGAIPAEIFEGRHYGSIFGCVMLGAILGGAAGPYLAGILYDSTGTYTLAFWIAAGSSGVSSAAIWLAAPGKVRAVAGRTRRLTAMPRIRAAAAADVPAVARIVEQAYRGYVARIGRPPGPMLDDYAARVAEGVVWVIEEGPSPAGIIVLLPRPDHLLLDNIAVAPGRQRAGLGRRLLAFAEEEAARRGYPEIRLYTHRTMTENQRLYARVGYEETARGTDSGYERVFMRKRIGAA